MRYTPPKKNEECYYPEHSLPADQKGRQWCMLYAKAAWQEWISGEGTILSNNNGTYHQNRLYAMGKQPFTKYQALMGIDKEDGETHMNIDWQIRPILSKIRDIAIARLMQNEHSIVATPIDPTAKAEADEYYARAVAKITARNLMIQQNPELANHPLLARQSGEPVDLEEMGMRIDLGEQFNRSKDAELAIRLGFYSNNYREVRRKWYEDFFDNGIAGYRESLGDDGRPKFRNVNPDVGMVSNCEKADFSDARHAGERILVPISDLAILKDENGELLFGEKELRELSNSVMGKWGNPKVLSSHSANYDKFKVEVLDITFFTWNDLHSNSFVNSKGNLVWEKKNKPGTDGRTFKRSRIKYVYQCKWVIGTDICYDFGMAYDQKRKNNLKQRSDTTLPFRFKAFQFYNMMAVGMIDRLKSLADDYMMTVYRIQNFKARAVPAGWWIDLDALENVALTDGGKNLEPKELINTFFQTGVLVGRSSDLLGNNQNYKPIIPIENTALSELSHLYEDLFNILGEMQRIVGLNDITDGSTPNPKTLVPGYENANASTNNALYAIAESEKYLTESLAEDVMYRTQQGLKRGDSVEGYAPALHSNTLLFIKVSHGLRLRDYGIMLEERSTEDQKQLLIANMQQDKANGFLDTSDSLYILNTYNIKQAQMILGYRVKKAKEAQRAHELQQIQLNNEGNLRAAQEASALKQQELAMEWDFKTRFMEREYELKMQLLQMELQEKSLMNSTTAQAKVMTQQTANEGKLQENAQKNLHESIQNVPA